MLELGQLERRHEDFDRRHTRVIVASVDGTDDSRQTQEDFKHLVVLADEGRGLTDAAEILHARSGPHGEDIDAPTTFLVDRRGEVRWVYRPDRVITRLSPDEVLEAIDQRLSGASSAR